MAVDQKLLAAIQNIMEADNQILREEMAALIDTKLEPAGRRLDAILSDITRLKEGQQAVIERLDRMEGDIAEIREDAEITRDAANRLLAWAEEVGESVRVPLLEKERKMNNALQDGAGICTRCRFSAVQPPFCMETVNR